MHIQDLTKPDGRRMTLYSIRPIPARLTAPSPFADQLQANPHLMAWYQSPTDGAAHPETQLHAELLPPYGNRERLKYLAGTELGAGMFAMDTLPENTAAQFQQVVVTLEEAA